MNDVAAVSSGRVSFVIFIAVMVLLVLAWGDNTCAPEPGDDRQFMKSHEGD